MDTETSQSYYLSLILQKDALKSRGIQIEIDYFSLFGEVLQRNLKLKMKCISRRNAIQWMVIKNNQGKVFDQKELDAYESVSVEEMKKELEELKLQTQISVDATPVSPLDSLKIRKLYHSLAHRIHPDLHPEIWKYEGMSDLWEKARTAYLCSSLSALEEVSFQVSQFLKEHGGDFPVEPVVNIEEKIDRLLKEIEKMSAGYPFVLEPLLTNPRRKEFEEALEQEYEDYQVHLIELTALYEEQLERGLKQEG